MCIYVTVYTGSTHAQVCMQALAKLLTRLVVQFFGLAGVHVRFAHPKMLFAQLKTPRFGEIQVT